MRTTQFLVFTFLICTACKNKKNDTRPIIKETPKEIVPKLNDKGVAISETNDSIKILALPTAFYIGKENKYNYKFNLEKGKTYPFNSRNIETNTAKRGDESMSQTSEILDKMTFTVLEEKPDFYILNVTYISTKNTIKANGKSITIDSEGLEPKDENMKKDWKMRKALMGNSFTMELYKTGKIGKIKGMEGIYTKVEKDLKNTFNTEMLKNVMETVKKQIINPTLFKEQFSATMIKFPKEGVALGGTWKEKGIKAYTEFKFEKIEGDYAVITLKASLPPDTQSKKQQEITISAKKSGNIKGKLYINKNSGWIDKGENTRTITIKMTQTYQGKSITQTETNTNKTYINQ